MAEKLSPEAQKAFDLQRGMQVALIEQESGAVADLQKRAAELAAEFADDAAKEAASAAKAAKDASKGDKVGDTGDSDSIAPGDADAVTEKAKADNQG